MEQSAEDIGDLYLDVGEAFLEEGEYMSALPLMSALVISEKYNLAVVWLRHAGEANTVVLPLLPLYMKNAFKLSLMPSFSPSLQNV